MTNCHATRHEMPIEALSDVENEGVREKNSRAAFQTGSLFSRIVQRMERAGSVQVVLRARFDSPFRTPDDVRPCQR